MLQLYTQNGGVRPFGSALIIGGVYDGKCKLFETDPSGALIEYKATAIGSGRNAAMEIFEEKYDDDLTLDGAIELALTAINEATDHDTTSQNVEIAVIKIEDEKYVKLSQDEVQKYIDEVLVEEEEEEDVEEESEEVEEDSEEDEEYQEFLEKFEAKKTTDDCYTPDNIYDAVKKWCIEKYGLKGKKIIRPFYPGGDYQKED